MKPSRISTGGPTDTIFVPTTYLGPNLKRVCDLRRPSVVRFPVTISTGSRPGAPSSVRSLSPTVAPETESGPVRGLPGKLQHLEEMIEKVIYGCRFLAIFAVWGSLVGSLLCFVKGCTYVVASYQQYFVDRAKVIFWLVESIDVYLLGTVMLVFGMGLYELFISNLDVAKLQSEEKSPYRSNLFGLFTLKDLKSKIVIGTGDARDDLYYLRTSSSTALATLSDKFTLWHQRLGHPAPSSLPHSFICSHNNKTPCDACLRGEYTRLPFNLVLNKSSFERIFVDI